MAPCIEVVRCAATPTYKAEGISCVEDIISWVAQSPGALGAYTGTEMQDPDFWFFIVVWDKQQSHQDLIDSGEVYQEKLKNFGRACTDMVYRHHAHLELNEPYDALNAPVTELMFWTLKDGTDRAAFIQTLNTLLSHSNRTFKAIHKGGWGPVVEDERKFVTVLGWDSIEAFMEVVRGNETVKELLGKLKSQADFDVRHVSLRKH